LYAELIKTEEGKIMAMAIYTKARDNYHSVSSNTLDTMLGWK
jgi:leukotriene-A4 hydrolase